MSFVVVYWYWLWLPPVHLLVQNVVNANQSSFCPHLYIHNNTGQWDTKYLWIKRKIFSIWTDKFCGWWWINVEMVVNIHILRGLPQIQFTSKLSLTLDFTSPAPQHHPTPLSFKIDIVCIRNCLPYRHIRHFVQFFDAFLIHFWYFQMLSDWRHHRLLNSSRRSPSVL